VLNASIEGDDIVYHDDITWAWPWRSTAA